MMWVYVLWFAMFCLIGGSTLLTVWAREDTFVRRLAMYLFFLSIPAFGLVVSQTLGWHKPYALTWDLPIGDSRVLANKMVLDEGIYLYLDDHEREPRPIVLPWSNEMANEIQKLIEEAAPDSNGQFMMRYEPSYSTSGPMFHPMPQPPALLPKPQQPEAPHLEGGDA